MTNLPRVGRAFKGCCSDCLATSVPIQVSPTTISVISEHAPTCPFLARIIRQIEKDQQ